MSITSRRVAFTTIALLWIAALGLVVLTGVEFWLSAQDVEPQASDPRYREIEAAYQPFAVQHLHPNYLFWFPLDAAQRQALNNPVCSLSAEGFRGPGPSERGTRKLAQAYLEYLYSPEAQEIAGKHYYRPSDPGAAAKFASRFPAVKLFTLAEVAGDWRKATQVHFADGGVFDQVYLK